MKIITREDLFEYNINLVLSKIERDYSREIMDAYDSKPDILTFQDWLDINPAILGSYMFNHLIQNFDFEQFNK